MLSHSYCVHGNHKVPVRAESCAGFLAADVD